MLHAVICSNSEDIVTRAVTLATSASADQRSVDFFLYRVAMYNKNPCLFSQGAKKLNDTVHFCIKD